MISMYMYICNCVYIIIVYSLSINTYYDLQDLLE